MSEVKEWVIDIPLYSPMSLNPNDDIKTPTHKTEIVVKKSDYLYLQKQLHELQDALTLRDDFEDRRRLTMTLKERGDYDLAVAITDNAIEQSRERAKQ